MPATKKKPAKKPGDRPVTESALKLVDEAAALLRKGISAGSDSGEKAHSLLKNASSPLSDILGGSASALGKVVGKL